MLPLFVCLFGFLTSSSTTRLYRGRAPIMEHLTIRAATHETELGDHDFCLSRSHYTDTDPTCRERAATTGIQPGTSSPGVARSTAKGVISLRELIICVIIDYELVQREMCSKAKRIEWTTCFVRFIKGYHSR